MTDKSSNPICYECKSSLILISKETVQLEGSHFMQTNFVYRCSNEACQKEKDKEKAGRLKQQQKREEYEQKRAELIKDKKKIAA